MMNRKMDIHEILEIFGIPNVSDITGGCNLNAEGSEVEVC
jgi:hypothetical protein